jgi:ribosomal RNA-processing protein 9
MHEVHSESEGIIRTPRWITALASLRYSDLFMSGMRNPFIPFHSLRFQLGSWEGDIRIWKIDAKLNSFSLVGKISAPGVVNSLQLLTAPKGFSKTIAWGSQATTEVGFVMVAGLGQEHRLGRWLTVKEGGAVNQAMVCVY